MTSGSLPFFLHPATMTANAPLLLFLHGVGEGFVNRDEIGAQNLFKQGPPKHLGRVPVDHPLRTSFTMLAPQLPDRDTLWANVLDDVKALLRHIQATNDKLYIMGFSKGGLGAFQIGRELGARALVTIDASPMHNEPAQAVAEWVTRRELCPFWAIYTSYMEGERLRRVRDFNDLLPANTHASLEEQPGTGQSWRSFVSAPADASMANEFARHAWISDCVATIRAPYNWLRQH